MSSSSKKIKDVSFKIMLTHHDQYEAYVTATQNKTQLDILQTQRRTHRNEGTLGMLAGGAN